MFDLDDTILEYDGSADRVWCSVVAEFAGGTAGLDIERFMAALNEYREWYWGDPERRRRGRLDLPRAPGRWSGVPLTCWASRRRAYIYKGEHR